MIDVVESPCMGVVQFCTATICENICFFIVLGSMQCQGLNPGLLHAKPVFQIFEPRCSHFSHCFYCLHGYCLFMQLLLNQSMIFIQQMFFIFFLNYPFLNYYPYGLE